MLLVAGGARDPSLLALIARAHHHRLPVHTLLVGEGMVPALSWDLQEDRLILEGDEIRPDALFIRYDVFEELHDPRPEVVHQALAWHTTVIAWALAHPDTRMFNATASTRSSSKPAILHQAARYGFQCPAGVVSNEIDKISTLTEDIALIAKPVAGGGFCEDVQTAIADSGSHNGRAASPAIVQEYIHGLDIRIYRVGDAFLTYRIVSEAVDYRTDPQAQVERLEPGVAPHEVFDRLWHLTENLGLDFCAVDFKLSEATGMIHLLEINNAPMFAVFDACDGGALSDAILTALPAHPPTTTAAKDCDCARTRSP